MQEGLIARIKKHFEILVADGSILGEIREVAPGIMVAADTSDKSFLYYFDAAKVRFKSDRRAALWSVNDQCGPPAGGDETVIGFVCGVNRPKSWSDVIPQAKERLEAVSGSIAWYSEPRPVQSEKGGENK